VTGPIRVGHSVNLIPLGEVAKVLRTSEGKTRALLKRLGVPVGEDYGKVGPVVSQAAFEAAVFRDLFVRPGKGHVLPLEASRVYQGLAAADYCILDRAALMKRLRRFALELSRLRKKK